MHPDAGPDGRPPAGPPADRLDSWKEIAAYLGRGVTTVQRWEKDEGLPVRRLPHAKKGSVFAYASELDAWRDSRASTGVLTRGDEEDGPALSPSAVLPDLRAPVRSLRLVAGAVVLLLAAGVLVWSLATAEPSRVVLARLTGASPAPAAPIPVAATTDAERGPSLSPDGRQLAFSWNRQDAPGLYVRDLAAGSDRLIHGVRRGLFVTSWSPTGDRIAFNVLEGEDTYGLFVVGLEGGAPQRLTTMHGTGICWSPDGGALTFVDRTSASDPFSLYALSLSTGQRTRLTAPPAGTFGDTSCAWAPDGRRLAVARFTTRTDSDVLLVEPQLGDAAPRALTSGTGGISGVAWTPDGEAILFGGYRGVMMVDPAGGAEPVRIAGPGPAGHPALSREPVDGGLALAYQVQTGGMRNWAWSQASPDAHAPWLPDPLRSEFPAFSRDGRRIAFVRSREVWVSAPDGSNPRQVTFHGTNQPQRVVTGPQWSPDGARLAFSVPVGEQRDIYLIDADGSNSTRLTHEPSLEDNPSWSSDGRWIYFRSDRGGLNQIWKAPATGGPAVQVTAGEGMQAFESFDGRTLYFVRATWQPGLWARPAAGGQERFVVNGPVEGLWAVGQDAVFFVTRSRTDERVPVVVRLDMRDESVRTVVTLPGRPYPGLSVAPDGSRVIWTRALGLSFDVMLVSPWRR